MLKTYFLVRTDLDMGKGKIAGQVAHATQNLVVQLLDTVEGWSTLTDYMGTNSVKIVLKVPSGETLLRYKRMLEERGIKPVTLVINTRDTQVSSNTFTVLGVGPIEEKQVKDLFEGLKLL